MGRGALIMGAISVFDARPSRTRATSRIRTRWVDAHGNGPLLMTWRSRRPLHVGDPVHLPDGSTWLVVTSRQTVTFFGWRQEVAVGDVNTACAPHSVLRHLKTLRSTAVA